MQQSDDKRFMGRTTAVNVGLLSAERNRGKIWLQKLIAAPTFDDDVKDVLDIDTLPIDFVLNKRL